MPQTVRTIYSGECRGGISGDDIAFGSAMPEQSIAPALWR